MDNRKMLIAHAMELFASRGYDAVGVQEIVEAANVTKPTLYHYFGSKQGLLRGVLAAHYQGLYAEVSKAADYHGDLPLTLRRIVSAFFTFAQGNPIFYRMQLSMFFAPNGGEAFREVAELNDRLFSLLETVFELAAHDHGNMKDHQKLYAASFLGMINNCISLSLNGYLSLNEALIERAVHQFEHGIYS